MVNPYSYPCNHYICENCLSRASQSSGSEKLKTQCPICNSEFARRSIKEDPVMGEIISKARNVIQTLDPSYEDLDLVLDEEEEEEETWREEELKSNLDKEEKDEEEKEEEKGLEVGDMVEVLPRSWPGMNKQGGVGRVTFLHYSSSPIKPLPSSSSSSSHNQPKSILKVVRGVDVKYVVSSGQDMDIPIEFVRRWGEEGVERGEEEESKELNEKEEISNDGDGHIKKVRKSRRILSQKVAFLEDGGDEEGGEEESGSNSSSSSKNGGVLLSPSTSIKLSSPSTLIHNQFKRDKMTILTSSLPPTSLSLVHKFKDEFDTSENMKEEEEEDESQSIINYQVEVVDYFEPTISHLIINTSSSSSSSSSSRIAKTRTLKYLKSLLCGKWILDVRWVKDSIKSGVILREEEYEIFKDAKSTMGDGPKRARLHMLSHRLSSSSSSSRDDCDGEEEDGGGGGILFDGIEFSLTGIEYWQEDTQPSSTDISQLILLGGGTIVPYSSSNTNNKKRKRSESSSKKRIRRNVVVRGGGEGEGVSTQWVLDSISNYKIQNEDSYLLNPKPP